MEREERREELEGTPEEVSGEPATPYETPSERIVGPGEPVAPPGTEQHPFTPPPPPTAPSQPDVHAPGTERPEPDLVPPPPPPPPAPAATPEPGVRRDDESRGRQIVAIILILVGIWLLADQFLDFDVGRLWPVILIILGLLLIFRRP